MDAYKLALPRLRHASGPDHDQPPPRIWNSQVLEIAKRVLGGTHVDLMNSIIRGYAESHDLKKAYDVFRMLGSDVRICHGCRQLY